MDSRIIQALRSASRVVVFTGAGVSAESWIPTFRDKQTGLWENFDAAELATPSAFERDPSFVWARFSLRALSARTPRVDVSIVLHASSHFTDNADCR